MSYPYVWGTIAAAQLALFALTATLLVVTRDRRARSVGLHDIVAALLDRFPPEDRETAIAELRTERWMRRALSAANSRFWWRRLTAARLLALVGNVRDRAVIERLIADSHPAVQSAGTECLLRYADEGLVAQVLDGLTSRTVTVQAYQTSVLRHHAKLAVPLILARIRADAPPIKLIAYIDVACALETKETMECIASLSIHQNSEVRIAVARALRDAPSDLGIIKLLSMLRDPDWRVRAQAARGLGLVHDERAVKELTRALADQAWWVRFRAGLSLAMLGDAGRAALEDARSHSDRYGRDMAIFVSGLSDASVAELAGDT